VVAAAAVRVAGEVAPVVGATAAAGMAAGAAPVDRADPAAAQEGPEVAQVDPAAAPGGVAVAREDRVEEAATVAVAVAAQVVVVVVVVVAAGVKINEFSFTTVLSENRQTPRLDAHAHGLGRVAHVRDGHGCGRVHPL
jgi:hypothetical protein